MNRTSIAALTAVLLIQSPAHASGGITNAEGSAVATSTVATVVVPLTAVGLAIYGIVTTTRNKETPPDAAEAFLRENATQLIVDLTAGDGPVLRDLAQAAEISSTHYVRFAERLRRDRANLLELSTPAQLNAERAHRFMTRIGELIQSDASLAADYAAFIDRHGQPG